MFAKPIAHFQGFSIEKGLRWANSLWPLAIIVLASFAIRLVAALWAVSIIDGEGSEYARIAQNLLSGVGYVGIATPGKQLFFPPLYPLMIAGGALITGDAEISARCIALISGALLPVPVYFIARRLYGAPVALGAAALVGVHPHLIWFSTTAFCEPLFMTLVLSAIYMSMRSWDGITSLRVLVMGLAYGAAYLVRPEALAYVVLAGILLVVGQLYGPSQRRPLLRVQLLLLSAGFLLFAVPYTAWLSAQVGHFMLQGKSIVNLPTEKRQQQGMSEHEAAFGIAPDLTVEGVWLLPNTTAVRQFDIKLSEMPILLAKRGMTLAADAFFAISIDPAFGGPALVVLALLGLFSGPWKSRYGLDQVHLLLVLFIGLFGLLFTYALQIRFYVTFVPVLCVWAAQGIYILSRWIGTIVAPRVPAVLHAPTFVAICLVAASAFLIPSSKPGLGALGWERAQRPWKEQILRLAEEYPAPMRIAATQTPPAFHARAAFTWLPYTDAATARRYLQRAGVTHVVLWDRNDVAPYLDGWSNHGVPDARLVSAVSARGSDVQMKIYELVR